MLEADNQDWLASALELIWEDILAITEGSPTIGGLLRLLVRLEPVDRLRQPCPAWLALLPCVHDPLG